MTQTHTKTHTSRESPHRAQTSVGENSRHLLEWATKTPFGCGEPVRGDEEKFGRERE